MNLYLPPALYKLLIEEANKKDMPVARLIQEKLPEIYNVK